MEAQAPDIVDNLETQGLDRATAQVLALCLDNPEYKDQLACARGRVLVTVVDRIQALLDGLPESHDDLKPQLALFGHIVSEDGAYLPGAARTLVSSRHD